MPDPANPQSLNRYSYCLNNPLKYIDPSGFEYIDNEGMNDNGDFWYYVYKSIDENGNYTDLVGIFTGADSWLLIYNSDNGNVDGYGYDYNAFYQQLNTEAVNKSGYNEWEFFGGNNFGISDETALAYAILNQDSVFHNGNWLSNQFAGAASLFASGLVFWAEIQLSKTGISVDDFIGQSKFDKPLNKGEQYIIRGNVDKFLKSLTVGADKLPNGYYKLSDGTVIGKHISKKTRVPTIDINRNGEIIKVRVTQ